MVCENCKGERFHTVYILSTPVKLKCDGCGSVQDLKKTIKKGDKDKTCLKETERDLSVTTDSVKE
jgi:hypothetical protein